MAPLHGITVIALEQAISAPLCTRTLGDLGARIIKVENPEGGDFTRDFDDVVGGLAAHFVWANRGKESVTINLRSPDGRALLHTLLDRADVLVSNLSPGSMGRLGFASADVAARHPDLVSMEIDGYGQGGPLSHKRAYDLLVMAESGACAVTGTAGAPAKPGPPMADVGTGLYAALSIVAMLLGRTRGVAPAGTAGPAITLSMFDTMTDFMGYPLTYAQHTGIDQVPVGMGSPAVAPYGAYPTADGQTVVLGTTNNQEWQRFATGVLGRPDLAADDRFRTAAGRVAHREELDDAVGTWCARRDLAMIQAIADHAGIGNARYNRPTEVIGHPHLSARDRWRWVESPVGPIRVLRPPPSIAGHEPDLGAVPGLGEHTDAVLAELGLDRDHIEQLRQRGAIGPAYRRKSP